MEDEDSSETKPQLDCELSALISTENESATLRVKKFSKALRGDGGGDVRSMGLDTEQLAYLVLEAANRTQGKGTTVRLVVPRAQEVTDELDPTLAEHELLAAEEYLLERGHIAPANIGLTWGTYTITQAGLEWLERGFTHEEAALESALRAEVEEESRRLEEFERELDEARRELVVAQDPPGAAPAVREEPGKDEPWSSTGGAQEGVERPWWRRLLNG